MIPHFSIMGNVDDTVLMVETIRKKFPDNFLGLAGLSAGSGQVSFSSSLSSAQNVTGLNLRGWGSKNTKSERAVWVKISVFHYQGTNLGNQGPQIGTQGQDLGALVWYQRTSLR